VTLPTSHNLDDLVAAIRGRRGCPRQIIGTVRLAPQDGAWMSETQSA
jgi:hypothetical protein